MKLAQQSETVPVAAAGKPAFERVAQQTKVALAAATAMQTTSAQ